MAPEREALWARLGKAEFLTADEKRAAVGYGPGEGGGEPAAPPGPVPTPGPARAAKFNPYHDELGRFTTADGAAGGGDDPFADARPPIDVEQGEGDDSEKVDRDNAEVQLAANRSDGQHNTIDLEEEDAKYGGHGFRNHVARSDEELLGIVSRDRYDFFGLTIARKAQGSFLTKEDANDLVNRVIEENALAAGEVAEGRLATAKLERRFGFVTGKEAFRADVRSEPFMRPTYEVLVIIDHDRRSPRGFRVFTAYPRNKPSKQ